MELEIRFCAMTGGASLAYATLGEGSPLVFPPGSISHLALKWGDPAYRAFFEALARRHTVVLYDRYGCGLSERRRSDFSLGPDVDALAAVIDHLGAGRVTLFGISAGSLMVVAYAARHPERVDRLIVHGGGTGAPAGMEPGYLAQIQAVRDLIRANWGLASKTLADVFVPGADLATRNAFARFQRESATAEVAAEMMYLNADVTEQARLVRTPTLVLHRDRDPVVPFEFGRTLASLIPGAKFVPLEGADHFPWLGDSDAVLRQVAGFLGDPPEAYACRAVPAESQPAGATTASSLYPNGLSAREVEVLSLIAAGKSNQQIAAALVLSPNTVAKHINHIFTKTGVANRAEATDYAHRHGLLV